MADPIIVVDYDPGWPAEFERLRDRAEAAVGELAVTIEHIGSTAVPGLAAKPVIDLAVVVAPSDVRGAVERLEAIGYLHFEGDVVEDREVFSVPKGETRHHLYLYPSGSKKLRAHITFRDNLRSDPGLAAEYEALKRQLAERYRDDRVAYTDGKTDFVTRASRSSPRASPSP